jgi:hypothetical protein
VEGVGVGAEVDVDFCVLLKEVEATCYIEAALAFFSFPMYLSKQMLAQWPAF